MQQSKKFFAMRDHSNEKALRHFDRSLQSHMEHAKASLAATGDEPDLPVSGRDYGPFMPVGDEEIVWPSKDEIDDEKDGGEDPPVIA
ncbi:hypothetical protein Q3G72_012966 [Acer saccharum]|nr:hypothetical protein Q3G72_012966 [Acer saccharum]